MESSVRASLPFPQGWCTQWKSYLCSGIQIESLEAKMPTDAEDNLQLRMEVEIILKSKHTFDAHASLQSIDRYLNTIR
jgi:hypothetical protein